MSDKLFDRMVSVALEHTATHADRANKLAKAINDLLEGGDPEPAAELLQKYGYTDEDGFWVDE